MEDRLKKEDSLAAPSQLLMPALRALMSEEVGTSLRTRFVKGSVWSLAGSGISQGLSMAASVATARLLGKEQFGEYGIVQSTVGLFGTFAGIGLGLTATKFVAEWRMNQPERAGKVISLSLLVALFCSTIVSVVLFVSAPLLASRMLNAAPLVLQLRIGCALLFANALAGAQTGALSGFEAFQAIARATLIRGLLSLPVTIACTYFWGLTGAVAASVAASVIGLIVNHWYLLRSCKASHVPFLVDMTVIREWKILWSYSLPAFLSGAINSPVGWVLNAMLVNQPNGYAEMGVFTAAAQWRSAFLFVPGVIGQVVMPLVSSLQLQSDRRRVQRVLLGAMAVACAVSIPLLAVLTIFSDRVIAWYGRGFAGNSAVLIITSVTATLLAILTPVGNVISGLGKMWLAAFMNIGQAIVLLVAAWILLEHSPGALALAKAYLISYVAHAIWTGWFAATVIRPEKSFRPVATLSDAIR